MDTKGISDWLTKIYAYRSQWTILRCGRSISEDDRANRWRIIDEIMTQPVCVFLFFGPRPLPRNWPALNIFLKFVYGRFHRHGKLESWLELDDNWPWLDIGCGSRTLSSEPSRTCRTFFDKNKQTNKQNQRNQRTERTGSHVRVGSQLCQVNPCGRIEESRGNRRHRRMPVSVPADLSSTENETLGIGSQVGHRARRFPHQQPDSICDFTETKRP